MIVFLGALQNMNLAFYGAADILPMQSDGRRMSVAWMQIWENFIKPVYDNGIGR